jgi:hypothetical protein
MRLPPLFPLAPLARSGASLLVAAAILLIAHPALAGARANYIEVASWETGYQAQYTITNDGPGDVTQWRVIFDLPAGSSPSSSWDSVRSGSGQHLIFDNAAWNGSLAPGHSTTFGFVIVGLGRPARCTINGGPCDTLAPLAAAPRRTTIRAAGENSGPSFDRFDGTEIHIEAIAGSAAIATRRYRIDGRALRGV